MLINYNIDLDAPPVGPPCRQIMLCTGETEDSIENRRRWNAYIKEYGRLINERNKKNLEYDINKLLNCIQYLWKLLDDIDTVSDMVKSDNELYRKFVEKYQSYRWETGIITDGYNLDLSVFLKEK